MPDQLEVSKYNRSIAWLGEWSWYGGKATGSCLFSNKEEAIRWARFSARGSVDWNNFPDPKGKYPYEERDGSEGLTPIFVAQWNDEGGGRVTVKKMEICDKFDWYAKNTKPDGSLWPQTWDISKTSLVEATI